MNKRILFLLIISGMAALNAAAAQLFPAKGRIVDQQGDGVEYATVVLLRDGRQVVGMATDTDGRFQLDVPAGDYTLSVQYLGFDPIARPIRVGQSSDLGDIVLTAGSTRIEGVEVTARLIRREADRFVVDVANAPAAIGKDGIELLERAPGVWIDNEKISINGKSGSKVFVNDRELRMEPEQLLAYLRSLRAEEIQKIEVIPVAGADQDADASGGIIRITLKKRRENGTEGSLSVNSRLGDEVRSISPRMRLNYHSGRLDLYGTAWGSFGADYNKDHEHTSYTSGDMELRALSRLTERDRDFGFSLGSVCEIDARNSVGAEFEFSRDRETSPTSTYTDFTSAAGTTRTDSRYKGLSTRRDYTLTLNYIHKIDTLGSTLKLLVDYNRRTAHADNDRFSRITAPASVVDSTYRDNSVTRYNVTTATLALDKKFSSRWSLAAGAKYTYNDMYNSARYDYLKDNAWIDNHAQSFTVDYTEHIAAVYGIVKADLGRLNLVAGLRGEYTHTQGKLVGQDYASLFPNANISYALTPDGSCSLIAQYARTIERPRFWALNPQREQVSDYTYQTGNPELDPSYKHDVNLTLVLGHKYTLTGGLYIQTGEIQQTMRPDADNPDLLCLTSINFDTTQSYYLTASLPFQPAKWWSLDIRPTYFRRGERIAENGPEVHHNMLFINASTTFTLPAKFYIDLSYRYQSRMDLGNCWVNPTHGLDAGLKKRFGERFTASFSVRNLLDRPQYVGARGEEFVRKVTFYQQWNNINYRIGLTYNFKSGKAFRQRAVEAGSAEEKSRL